MNKQLLKYNCNLFLNLQYLLPTSKNHFLLFQTIAVLCNGSQLLCWRFLCVSLYASDAHLTAGRVSQYRQLKID
jgi:hypothetical protein